MRWRKDWILSTSFLAVYECKYIFVIISVYFIQLSVASTCSLSRIIWFRDERCVNKNWFLIKFNIIITDGMDKDARAEGKKTHKNFIASEAEKKIQWACDEMKNKRRKMLNWTSNGIYFINDVSMQFWRNPFCDHTVNGI